MRRPPRLTARLLELLVHPADADAVLGDLDNEFTRQLEARGRRGACRWYRRQAVRSLWPVVARRWLDGGARETQRLPADRRGARPLDALTRDLRYAARALSRSPGFTAIAVFALALGIGASTSVFSVVDTLLLSPLPYPEADRLMMLWETNVEGGAGNTDTPAPANFLDWKRQSTSFAGMAAFVSDNVVLTGVDEPERLDGYRVGEGFFDVLGVGALVGRTLLAGEDEPGNGRVVVLSYRFWQRRFNGDERLVGDTIQLAGIAHHVAGVMPADFEFPVAEVDYWRPMAMTSDEAAQRRAHYLRVIGRLAPKASFAGASAEMDTIGTRLARQYPDSNQRTGVLVQPLREEIVGDLQPTLVTVAGAVVFVLMIACANVAGLMLARASVRAEEVAVRAALGASRSRIVRQFLAEATLLAALGGLGGLALSIYGVELLKALVPADLPVVSQIGMDARVLLFTAVVATSTAVLFGVAPALHAARQDPGAALNGAARDSSAGRGRQRFRAALVTLELALALTLLVGAGLLMRSFLLLSAVEPGFDTAGLLSVRFDFSSLRYEDYATRVAFYDDVLERVSAMPGVESAGMITVLPMTFSGGSTGVTAESGAQPDGERPVYPVFRVVSPGYIETMRIPLRGRGFTRADRQGGEPVAIVNEAFARHFWPGAEGVGKRVKLGGSASSAAWMTVIAVVGDVRQFGMETQPRPELYISYLQSGDRGFFLPRDLVLRTAGNPPDHIAWLRATVRAIDADMPLSEVRTVDEIVAGSVAQHRFNTLLIGAFATAALLLAAVGVYGVVSHAVGQRTREIGVRMALGADGTDVLRMVLLQGTAMIAAGTALGLAGGLLAGRVMGGLLYEVSPVDPATFIVVAAGIVLVALAATLVPARRALRVDPIVALQSD